MSSASTESANLALNQPLTLALIKSYQNKISMTDYDTENNLSMFCYNKCSADSDDVVKSCRGVVFQDEKLVMRAFPYTQEFSEEDVTGITTLLEPVFDKCRFFTSEEGSLIRMFAVTRSDGTHRWYTTTHRKFDAFRSKWASRESFGSAFVKALEEETKYTSELATLVAGQEGTLLERFQRNCLDPNVQYMFLVRNSRENRIVCQPPSSPRLFHVGSFRNGVLNFDPICVPMPKEHKFDNTTKLLEFVHTMDYNRHQGIIVFAPDNRQYKIFQSDYHYLFTVRGNEPSIKFRYLQLRNDSKRVKDLCYLYPDAREVFDRYEDYLYEICQYIYNAYVHRFIKKQFVSVPVEEFAVMKEVHSWHEQDRAKNRVSFQLVSEVLNRQHPTSLNRMIHRLVEEKRERDAQVSTPSQQPQPGILPTPTHAPTNTHVPLVSSRLEHQDRRGGSTRGGNTGRGRGGRGRGNPRQQQ
jgi:hypothetical protein